MVQASTGRWVGLIVAATAVIAGLFVSGPQSFFKIGSCSGSSSSSSSTTTTTTTTTSSTTSSCGCSSSSKTKGSILSIFAKEAFNWSTSTTPAPLSATAVLVKLILADKGKSFLPAELGDAVLSAATSGDSSAAERAVLDVKVGPVRDFVSSRILDKVRQLCASSPDNGGCDANEVDPDFGTTPLHLAELWGSSELSGYLLSIGADPEIFDTVGRQPRNMTFKAFSANSKKAAEARLLSGTGPDARCEIPEVSIPLFPVMAPRTGADEEDSSEIAAANEWQASATAALSEVRRLVSEGEPVMVRNVVPWLLAEGRQSNNNNDMNHKSTVLQFENAAQFVEAWGHRPVDVGSVPYAKNFDLTNERITLKDYVTKAGAAATAATATPGIPLGDKAHAPNYVFQVGR